MAFANPKKGKIVYRVFFALFFLGLLACTGAIVIFENTIINREIPVSIFLCTGLLIGPATSFVLKEFCKINLLILRLFFNVVSFGGLLIGLLLGINYFFTNDKEQSYKAEIIATGYSKSRGMLSKPYADVNINGTNKRLAFPHDVELKGYKFVVLDTKKGFLGFDVTIRKKPSIQ